MLRSVRRIGMWVNTISLAYSSMKLLPYAEADFAEYQGQRVQDFRLSLSETIWMQLIFTSFSKSLKNREKHATVIILLKHKFYGIMNII